MKNIFLLILFMFCYSCKNNKEKQTTTIAKDTVITAVNKPKTIKKDTSTYPYQVALKFLNGFIKDNNQLGFLEWTITSPLTTKNFKTALKNMVDKAWEEEPEFGLNFDPILDAQDYPDDGFVLHTYDSLTGYAVLKSLKWEAFKVTVKLVKVNGEILVDGSGIVNIPEDKQAERN
ncbi:MAG: hypothetical protein ACPG6B_06370 [Oceanihabitans sp.]